jgi:cytochrome P450
MLKLADQRRREPRDDIITAVAHLTADGGRLLNYYELGAVLSILLSGGVHTTTLAIESALAYIGRTPGMHEQLRDSPELVKPFCEEVLRMWPPLQTFFRKARKDVVINGQQISAGDGILLGIGSANRDPEEFPDPDVFVLERHPNRHMTFAVGIHRCLGSNLARQELLVTVRETIRQLPAFTVDEADTEISLHVDPVTYEPARKMTLLFDR